MKYMVCGGAVLREIHSLKTCLVLDHTSIVPHERKYTCTTAANPLLRYELLHTARRPSPWPRRSTSWSAPWISAWVPMALPFSTPTVSGLVKSCTSSLRRFRGDVLRISRIHKTLGADFGSSTRENSRSTFPDLLATSKAGHRPTPPGARDKSNIAQLLLQGSNGSRHDNTVMVT